MPENGGFLCGTDGLLVLATGYAMRTPSDQGERSRERSGARIPNIQEGHRVTRSIPNSHEGTDTGQESAEWLRVCPKR